MSDRYEIPVGWQNKRLEEIAESSASALVDGPFGSDLKTTDYTESGVRILQLQNLGDGYFNDSNKIYTSDSKATALSRCETHPGDIIIAKMAEPLSRAAIVPPIADKLIIVADLIRLRPAREFEPNFIVAMINSPLFRKEAERLSTGTTRTRISLSVLKKIDFPCPGNKEQKTIASVLKIVDSLITKTHSLIAKYNAIKQGMMQDLLYRGIDENGELRKPYEEAPRLYEKTLIGHIPKDWRLSPLDKYCRVQGGYAFSSLDFVETGIQLIRIGALYENRFDLKRDPVFLPYNFAEKFKEFLVESGDVLISLTGTVGKQDYGFAVMVPETKRKMLLNQRVGRFVTFDGISKRFLIQLLHSDLYLKQLYSQPGGTKQANLTGKQVVSALLPIPPILEQEQIADSILSVEKTIEKEKLFADKLHDIKSGLMQDLLTGKVRVKVDESTGNMQDVGVPQS